MSEAITEFGDFVISGSCVTLDATTAVPIYEFTPEKEGAYNIEVMVIAWQVGVGGAQYYLPINWTLNDGVLAVDGEVFPGAMTGSISPEGLSVDVSGGKARVLVKGIAATPLLWRLKGVRMDLTV